MTKIIVTVCVCALLLCACGPAGEDGSDVQLEKTQEIRIVSPYGALLNTLSNDAELDEFNEVLDAEEWEPVRFPENVSVRGEFKLYQTETLKFGQSPEDLQMKELGCLRLYDAPYAALEVFGMELCVKLSDTAWEDLNSYFE